jgi:hypothetical protein
MRLVDAVEERMGAPVEEWPTTTLTFILAFDPRSPDAILRITKVVVFMYINGVPLPMACRFFAACSSLLLSQVHDQFSLQYDNWSVCPKKFAYYDMRRRRWRYTDGSYVADMPQPVVGFPAGFPPARARLILQGVNRLEWVVETDR